MPQDVHKKWNGDFKKCMLFFYTYILYFWNTQNMMLKGKKTLQCSCNKYKLNAILGTGGTSQTKVWLVAMIPKTASLEERGSVQTHFIPETQARVNITKYNPGPEQKERTSNATCSSLQRLRNYENRCSHPRTRNGPQNQDVRSRAEARPSVTEHPQRTRPWKPAL